MDISPTQLLNFFAKKKPTFTDKYLNPVLNYPTNMLRSITIKMLLISIITGFFIYHRKLDYYKTIPRKDSDVAIIIGIWTLLSILDPIWIIVGLVILNVYGEKKEGLEEESEKEI